MSDDFSRQLDALMAQARADFQSEHAAMVEVARMLKRYAEAKGEIMDVAAYLADRRQPLAPQVPHPITEEQRLHEEFRRNYPQEASR